MEKDQMSETVSQKLSILISLLLEQSEKYKTTKDRVNYLSKFNLANIEIAQILNTSKNVVEVNLTNLKKGKK